MRPPRTKAEMYELYERGEFGNKLRTWGSVADLDGHLGTVTLRYAGEAGGRWAAYEVAPADVAGTVDSWRSEGADPKLVRLNESAPDDRLLIQGELAENPYIGGLVLRWSDWKCKMRDAMRHALHDWGLSAKMRLAQSLTPASYDDLMELLERFPGAVVEFSAYGHCLGSCRGRNAVIWEVRDY